ncbi:MAG: Lrp/AsnC family transcriptional regulator [Thermoleophilia bacterium]|nr:Lrp/AsnC family transcriptional regulator [Thermoleophilia bacterium]
MPYQPLDRIDRALVALLLDDARMSNKELAARVGIAPSTCLERVRALRARGVITGFHAEVDLDALGRGLEAIVAVRVRPHSRPHVDAFREAAAAMPEVIEVFHVTGADDFLLHVAVADTDALRDFVLDRLTMRPEVAHVESRVVYQHTRRPALAAQPSERTSRARLSPGPS